MNPHLAAEGFRYREQEAAEREAIIRATYRARLVGCHGPDRAAAIIAGQDEAFNADLAAWRNLGGARS